jgi:hypothetical protein
VYEETYQILLKSAKTVTSEKVSRGREFSVGLQNVLIEIKLKKKRDNVRPLLNVSLYQLLVVHPSVQNEVTKLDMNLCKPNFSWVISTDVGSWNTE